MSVMLKFVMSDATVGSTACLIVSSWWRRWFNFVENNDVNEGISHPGNQAVFSIWNYSHVHDVEKIYIDAKEIAGTDATLA